MTLVAPDAPPRIEASPGAPVPRATLGRASGGRLGAALPPLLIAALIVGAWEALTATGKISTLILPTPWAVLRAFAQGPGALASNGLYTVEEALTGFVVGNVVAIVLAVAFVHSDLARRVVYPLAMATQAVPIVAVAPALVLWLGNGEQPKIFVASFLVFFPTLVNMIRGLRNVDADADELLYTFSARWWQRLMKVRLPASLPYLFTALKLAALSCFVGAIVAEWIGSNKGLGYLIVLDSSQYKIPEMWAAILLASILSVLLYRLVVAMEHASMPWAPGEADQD